MNEAGRMKSKGNKNVNSQDIDESTSLRPTDTKVYKRRWYILTVFTSMNVVQALFVSLWGPIAETSEEAFGWTDGDVALILNWAGIGFLISAPLFCWLLDSKGLRVTTLTAGFVLALGTCISCITDKPPYVTWTANIGQFLNGLGGPAGIGMTSALSVIWFPPRERTTATAISTMLPSLGLIAAFIFGPYMVKDSNETAKCNETFATCSNHSLLMDDTDSIIAVKRRRIMKYLYCQAGMAVFVFVLLLLYFPAKPKLPPSLTASLERLDLKLGLKRLVKNKQFWLLCVSFCISNGVFVSWQSVLDINLKPHGISETEAGRIGLYMTLAPVIPSVVVAWFADMFSKHLKSILITLTILTAGFLLWLSLISDNDIKNSTASFYSSIILGPLFIGMTMPFYFERVCEVTYPVSEGVTTMTINFVQNVGITVFLLILMIPNIGTAWMNWCFFGGVAASIPLLCVLGEQYNRFDIDENKEKQDQYTTYL